MKLTLPDHPFKAYLFDCDGTIVDSMPLHFVAWGKALHEWECTFTEEQFYAWGGRPVDEIIRALNQAQGLNMPVDELMQRKEALYREMLHDLQGVPEVLEHIDRSYGVIPFAVVSGSPRASVEASLDVLGIRDRFEVLVCAGEYAKGKPNPEPFLKAASLLGVAPEDCLVFEDADPGIAAAEAAGMQWVKIESPAIRAAR
jgi:beta-phosphoglucomutase-like phosphatase (HAD superfamily)